MLSSFLFLRRKCLLLRLNVLFSRAFQWQKHERERERRLPTDRKSLFCIYFLGSALVFVLLVQGNQVSNSHHNINPGTRRNIFAFANVAVGVLYLIPRWFWSKYTDGNTVRMNCSEICSRDWLVHGTVQPTIRGTYQRSVAGRGSKICRRKRANDWVKDLP